MVADPTNKLMLQYDSFRAGDWVITGWVQLRGSAHNPFSTDILPTWGLDPLDFSYHGFYITCNGAKLAGTIDQFTVIPEPGSAFSMVGTVLLVALMRSRNRTCCSL